MESLKSQSYLLIRPRGDSFSPQTGEKVTLKLLVCDTDKAIFFLEQENERGKFAMQCLAALGGGSRIKNEILHINPILEAIGNAKTLRNDSSSRFIQASLDL